MTTADELLAAVYEAPDDDAPRAVYADWLQEQGDPRGEYIALELGTATRAAKARAKALLTAHADPWLEPLRGALLKSSVKWRRGFPSAGQLAAQRSRADAEAILHVPALATLRRLGLSLPNIVMQDDWTKRFVFGNPLRHLRELTGYPYALLMPMLRTRRPFAIEVLEIPPSGGGDAAEVEPLAEAFADGRGLPRLRELGLSFSGGLSRAPEHYAWLWTTALGKRVERLSINEGVHAVAAWQKALDRHPTSLRKLVLFGRNYLVLERSETGWDRLTVTPFKKLYPPERAHLDAELAALRHAGVTVTLTRE
jgi:uncharacterized protein (TIGR02996 family)